MVKKIGDKKVGIIDPTKEADSISKTTGVSGVDAVKPTSAVGGANTIGGVRARRSTRMMTMAEREELFKMVSEEAEKLFPPGTLPQHKKAVIAGAVKMAIDASITDEEPAINSQEDEEKK
jgi:peptide subunit release factor 1 (eRF1)